MFPGLVRWKRFIKVRWRRSRWSWQLLLSELLGRSLFVLPLLRMISFNWKHRSLIFSSLSLVMSVSAAHSPVSTLSSAKNLLKKGPKVREDSSLACSPRQLVDRRELHGRRDHKGPKWISWRENALTISWRDKSTLNIPWRADRPNFFFALGSCCPASRG